MTDRVREVFDDWARRGRAEGMERGHAPAARRALERLALGPSTRYLDLGCGNGYTVRWVAEGWPQRSALGIDLSPEMVARAAALSRHLPNAAFRQAALPDTGLPGASFDAIFSMEVLYYLPDPGAGLREIGRLLAPGGRFACVVDYYEENEASRSWPDDLGVPMVRMDQAGWRRAFEEAGFTGVEQERILHPPEEASSAWKVDVGSLMTLGSRPAIS